ncbi:MAG TPA: hypothetical protein VLZ07_05475, partial [Syntrophales bacterium]|nr:hypothetical protein [Syntrophales bacterium]
MFKVMAELQKADKKKLNISYLLLAILILTVAVAAVYLQVMGHDFISFDDKDYVLENPHVLTGVKSANMTWAFTTFYASNWHPLTWLSHMLDVQLFGLNAGMHHLVNVLFHIANSILLFLVLYRMT